MVEYKKMMEDGENEEVKNRVVTLDDLLKLQVGDSKITEKNKEEILHKFVVHMKHYKQMAKDSKFIVYMKHYKQVTKDSKFIIYMKHYKQMAKDSKFTIYMKHYKQVTKGS